MQRVLAGRAQNLLCLTSCQNERHFSHNLLDFLIYSDDLGSRPAAVSKQF